MYIYSECLFNTLAVQWDKTQMLQKFPLGKINVTKKSTLFFWRAPLIIVLLLLCELKHKVRLCKAVGGFSIFDSVSCLLKFIFLFNKKHILFDFKTSWFLSKSKSTQTSDISESWSSPKADLDKSFLNLENRSFEYVFDSPLLIY